MTPAQLKWLKRADKHGIIECWDNNGLVRANWRATMERMAEAGLVARYPHGGFELTADGRRARGDVDRLVLYSEEVGVYLGNAMGLGFWSKLDAVGQTHACVFLSERAALDHIASWDKPPTFALGTHPVIIASDKAGASVEECVAAGLPRWVP